MTKLWISPEAQMDLQEIKTYIATDLASPLAAQKLVLKITRAIRKLAEYPSIGASLSSVIGMKTEYRFLVCENYLAFYRYEDETVFVTRILYGKRDYMRILFGQLPPENTKNRANLNVDSADKRNTSLSLIHTGTFDVDIAKYRFKNSGERFIPIGFP